MVGTGKKLIMSIASIASGRPRNVENWLRFPKQTKAIGSEESDEHVLLADLIVFVEKSDQSNVCKKAIYVEQLRREHDRRAGMGIGRGL
jgi:hypothetical protein